MTAIRQTGLGELFRRTDVRPAAPSSVEANLTALLDEALEDLFDAEQILDALADADLPLDTSDPNARAALNGQRALQEVAKVTLTRIRHRDRGRDRG